jgi:anti-anti-sigma factor
MQSSGLLAYSRAGNHILFHVLTDIMMDNSKDFLKEFETILQREGTDVYIVSFNFEKVEFVDSSGAGSFIKAVIIARDRQCHTNIFNLNKPLEGVFQLTGLSTMISIYSKADFLSTFPEFQ